MSTSQALGVTSLKGEVTALVVDDDKVSQMIHHRLLNILGIENHIVGNGKEAVEIHLSGKKFNLILMDRDMPVMNGIEATKKLREMGIRSTIAGVSSHSVSQESQAFIEAGLDDYHEKPLSVTKLLSAISKIKHKAEHELSPGVTDQPLLL